MSSDVVRYAITFISSLYHELPPSFFFFYFFRFLSLLPYQYHFGKILCCPVPHEIAPERTFGEERSIYSLPSSIYPRDVFLHNILVLEIGSMKNAVWAWMTYVFTH